MIEVIGTIKEMKEVVEYSEKFRKREVIIETEEKYPQTLCIEFVNDAISQLDRFNVGNAVNIGINIRGREWTKDGDTKYFTSLNAWRISDNFASAKSEEENLSDLPF